jgi:hypothetical protein
LKDSFVRVSTLKIFTECKVFFNHLQYLAKRSRKKFRLNYLVHKKKKDREKRFFFVAFKNIFKTLKINYVQISGSKSGCAC